MGKRRSLKRIQRSGLSELLQRYTLETWEAKEPWQGNLADMVRGYADNPSGWFFLAGRPGTGKTHLCTALCGLLIIASSSFHLLRAAPAAVGFVLLPVSHGSCASRPALPGVLAFPFGTPVHLCRGCSLLTL